MGEHDKGELGDDPVVVGDVEMVMVVVIVVKLVAVVVVVLFVVAVVKIESRKHKKARGAESGLCSHPLGRSGFTLTCIKASYMAIISSSHLHNIDDSYQHQEVLGMLLLGRNG